MPLDLYPSAVRCSLQRFDLHLGPSEPSLQQVYLPFPLLRVLFFFRYFYAVSGPLRVQVPQAHGDFIGVAAAEQEIIQRRPLKTSFEWMLMNSLCAQIHFLPPPRASSTTYLLLSQRKCAIFLLETNMAVL